ncbi:uncharacterized protein [Miscanthus floridulus]|uniref:uncharacterized protein n=1 Tax=Miscanthus floridulus TaxID=154761 RepID=UPI00345ACBDA
MATPPPPAARTRPSSSPHSTHVITSPTASDDTRRPTTVGDGDVAATVAATPQHTTSPLSAFTAHVCRSPAASMAWLPFGSRLTAFRLPRHFTSPEPFASLHTNPPPTATAEKCRLFRNVPDDHLQHCILSSTSPLKECFCFRGPPPPFRPSPASRPSEAPARLALPPRPGPAQRRAGLPPRACSLTRRAARPDRGRACPPRGRPALASPAARQPWPGTAPTHLPSPAGARALAPSCPHFLPFSSTAASSELRHHRARAPPASNSRTTAPFSNSLCPELRLAFLEVALELTPPSEHRSGLPASRRRRPWRRCARPPWNPSSFSPPASPSYPTELAFSSHISCARSLALPWPETAAGRWPSRAVAPARAPARPLPSPASQAGQAKQPWAEALPGRRAPPFARAA